MNEDHNLTPPPTGSTEPTLNIRSSFETYEGDIESEIRSRSTSVAQIASADGVVENKKEPVVVSKMKLLVIFSSVVLVAVLGLIYIFLFPKIKTLPEKITTGLPSAELSSTTPIITQHSENLEALLPALFTNTDRYLGVTEKKDSGYIIQIREFNPVFAYIMKNEESFRDEALLLFEEPSSASSFIDISVGTLDARTLNDATSTLVYSFFDNKYLAVATSTEAILVLRNGILK